MSGVDLTATDEELAASFWADSYGNYEWTRRWGLPPALVESHIWNSIALAAQFNGWGYHRKMGGMNPPRMEIGQPAPPEVVAAWRMVAWKFGYEIVEIRDKHESFEFRVDPVCWPPPGAWRQGRLF